MEQTRRLVGATAIFFFVSLALVFGAFTVGRKVNVDENVFIASAALVARHVTLYRDFHYNHLPTLVILYAWLFQQSSYFLLAARSVSAICAAATATIFFTTAYVSFSHLPPKTRLKYALGIGVFYLANPLYTRTSGRAWNHDFPILFSLLAFLVCARGLNLRNYLYLFAAGILLTLAITARLTFATEGLPFLIFILIHPAIRPANRIGLLAAFAFGCVIALLPTVWFWLQSPANAFFGNFQYPALNTQWHVLHDNAEHHRYNILLKLWFYLFNICLQLPGNGIVLVAFLILLSNSLRWREVTQDIWQCQLLTLTLLAASQLASGLVPSPPFFQYFFPPTPFMYLAIIACLARIPNLPKDIGLNWIMLGCLAVALGFAIPEYRGLPYLFRPSQWFPVRAHEIGQQVRQRTGPGPVLTLDPIYVLDGGGQIYPALATGPFGMRVGDYLTDAQRKEFKMWSIQDVENLFNSNNPPAALLVSPGSDSTIEAAFIQLADEHGYHELQVNAKNPSVLVWIKPAK